MHETQVYVWACGVAAAITAILARKGHWHNLLSSIDSEERSSQYDRGSAWVQSSHTR